MANCFFSARDSPYLVGEAIAHILRGSLNRAVLSGLLAALLLSHALDCRRVGGTYRHGSRPDRVFPQRQLRRQRHFRRRRYRGWLTARLATRAVRMHCSGSTSARCVGTGGCPWDFVGASILAGFASPDANPQPGLAFLLFLPLAVSDLPVLVGAELASCRWRACLPCAMVRTRWARFRGRRFLPRTYRSRLRGQHLDRPRASGRFCRRDDGCLACRWASPDSAVATGRTGSHSRHAGFISWWPTGSTWRGWRDTCASRRCRKRCRRRCRHPPRHRSPQPSADSDYDRPRRADPERRCRILSDRSDAQS